MEFGEYFSYRECATDSGIRPVRMFYKFKNFSLHAFIRHLLNFSNLPHKVKIQNYIKIIIKNLFLFQNNLSIYSI